uniref:ATP-dependent DNA helicase n=1 Tax=Tanacetum cinerariifolium TaxID=118510 RepID=A0A6L2JU75_TANCI|nr:reverse transcriptase domain-containing protein [Tanacetum cinerariifolium]
MSSNVFDTRDDVDQFSDSSIRQNTVAPQQDMVGHTPSSSLVAPLNHVYLCMDVTEHTIRPQIISFSGGSLKDGSKTAVNQRSTFSSRTTGDLRARLVANSEESLANPGVTTPPDLGNCNQKCRYRGCLFWYAERLKGAKYDGQPEYQLCCEGGKIYTPQAPMPPLFIWQLLTNNHFMEHIRAYNQMFAITSFGATKVDDSVNKGIGPYVFKVSRRIYHWVGSLFPEEGHDPRFLQLYIYDTRDEVANRVQNFRGRHQHTLNPQIVEGLGGIRGYELPSSDLLGGIVFEDGPKSRMDFDVIIQLRGGPPQRINKEHQSYMSLQYPLLFVFGQSRFYPKMVLKPKDGSGQEETEKEFRLGRWSCYQEHLQVDLKIKQYMTRHPRFTPSDRADIVSRVFEQKVNDFIRFLKLEKPFSYMTACLYTIEFQKRGLPHCHTLLWVSSKSKITDACQIDDYIFAEIPDPAYDPTRYKVVTKLMMHGPCGVANPDAACTENRVCSKKFPKKYNDNTFFDTSGHTHYRIRETEIHFMKGESRLDNCNVVLYNRKLSLAFHAHIVEYCGWSMIIKYLFKYISKGPYRILAKRVSFCNRDRIDIIVNKPEKKKMTLTEWVIKTKQSIGRLTYVHLSSDDLFYFRMLLCHKKGYKSPDEDVTLEESTVSATSAELRMVFAQILLYCDVTDPMKLWMKHWCAMQDDIPSKVSDATGIPDYQVNTPQLQDYILYELEMILTRFGKSVKDFGLPLPPRDMLEDLKNKTLYGREKLQTRSAQPISFEEGRQELLFVYGHGGTGKTFLRKTIISLERSQGKIVLAVASSGIASLLLPARRTTHSRFKLPLDLTDEYVCHAKKHSQLGDLLIATNLIIWDKAQMNDRRCFEALDRTLRDLMSAPEIIFEGKTFILGGDNDQQDDEDTSQITVPQEYCIDAGKDGLSKLINFIYDDTTLKAPTTSTLQENKLYFPNIQKLAEKMHQEKAQQEKLKAVKARLNFEEASRYSESETPSWRRNLKERLGPRYARTRSGSPEPRRGRSKSPREKDPKRRTVFKRLEKGVFHRLGDKEKNVSAHLRDSKRKSYYSSRRDTESCYQSSRSKETEIAFEKHHHKREYSRRTEAVSESEGSAGGHWKSKPKKQKSNVEDDLSQPWVCEETDPLLLGSVTLTSQRPECLAISKHMTEESIDSYNDLRKAFLKNYLQQKKCIKDAVEIHNIKQRDGDSIKEFVRRYKLECRVIKGALECMKISRFMHGITNPELIKRLHDKIPKSMDEMMRVTTTFLRGENEERTEQKQDRFTLLTKTPKEILALDKGKFKPPLPMTTPVEKRKASKFCEFHGEVGHTTDECMHLKRQIKEMLKAEKLSHLIKELKRNHRKDQAETAKKGETSGKDKPLAMLMVQPLQRIARQRITQTFSSESIISFPTLGEEDRTEGPMIIEISLLVKIGDEEHPTSTWINFMVVRSPFPYNGIIGRPGKPVDMTGVPWHIVEHRLNVREGCLPVRQKKRGQAPERNKAVSEEVKKLVEADIMKEVHYHSWLSNPVMRFVDKAFQKQIGRNLKVYVDDLVIKSRTEKEVIRDTEETFKTLREINMKLNPKNCTFRMREGTFLGYKVDADGLRVCPEKVEAVLDLPSPKCLKDGKEELIMYLAAAKEAISAVLMTERDGKQVPIYFVSRALQGPEINYSPMEKLILALASASKWLKGYFQAHTIVVITDQPIKQLMSNLEVTERLLKWRFELGEHDIQYRPRTSVKGQILADFIVESLEDDTPDTSMENREELPDPWILFMDGSSCIDGFRAGLIITNSKGMKFTYALRFRFNVTNNEAEYEALIAGHRIARQMGVQNLQANVKNLASTFKGFSIKQIPKGKNKKADALSKITSTSFAHLSKQVLVEELREKAIDEKEILAVVEEEGHTWMTLVYEYLTEGILHEEKKKARVVRRKARRYVVINEVLYKKSFLGPWLRCVGPLQVNYVIREIHEGSCSIHAGSRSVVAKALRSGYYWPTMHTDAKNLIRECNDCQGIDIAGPFSEGPNKVKFLIVAMDYFTKWIEARPVATIIGAQVKKFVWDNIVCRFGLPGEIVSDNEKQFRDNPFKDWCEKLKEISHVLWAHRTMIKSSNGETPFLLTYGAEVMIPAEIGMPTLRTVGVDIVKNNEALGISLDLLEEKREQVVIQEARSKAKMERYYNAMVRNISFHPGDFVYRNNEASHAKDGGKLGPK